MTAGTSFSVCSIDGRDETHVTSCKCAGESPYKKWNKELYDHMNSGVSPLYYPPVPATIGALARILTNREEEPRGREEKIFFHCF